MTRIREDFVYTCPTCGATYDRKGEAETCLLTHAKQQDLVVIGIGEDDATSAYAPGNEVPTVIWIKNKVTGKEYRYLMELASVDMSGAPRVIDALSLD